MVNNLQTGIDLVLIKRIEKSIEQNADFLMRFFGDEERKLFDIKNPFPRIAANFAAKEAFSKAMQTGIVGFSLNEVQALRGENGAPYLYLTGKAEELAKKSGYTFSLSLSHTDEYATAIVVAYRP